MLENYSRLNLYKHLLQNIELFDLIEYIYTESFNRNTLIHFFLDMYNDIKTTEAQYFDSTIDDINYDYDDEIYNEFKNSKISYQNKIEKIDVKKPGLFITQTKDFGNIFFEQLVQKNIPLKNIPLENMDNRVFLSYAYEDKMYTLALYIYFLSQNIHLSIDWMLNTKTNSASILKEKLSVEIKRCNQLLFLRTPHSELKSQGNRPQVRQWCAWELGTFGALNNEYNYDRTYNEKYILNAYDKQFDNYSKINCNLFLNNLNPLTNVENGKLM